MKKITGLLCLIFLNSIKSSINNLGDNDLSPSWTKQSINNNDKVIVKKLQKDSVKTNDRGKVVARKNAPKSYLLKQLHKRAMLRRLNELPSRRRYKPGTSHSDSSSTSMEISDWKGQWKEHWLHKKLEAINSTLPTGDVVNMAAARPWGTPCGDPNQHDAPWGTCMLPMECEPEYRIYRGDYFCGRTMFICCALQLTNYDLYGGFDISFAGSSLATDSEERKNRDRGSKERKRRRKRREKKRRRRERWRRKRKIKKAIKKIVRELRKILNRTFRNGTRERKRKTRQLKKFIKEMKKKYRSDRKVVRDIHEMEMIKVDAALQKRLNDIRDINRQFNYNGTFRDLVVNGTINKKSLKMLVQAYPELADIVDARRTGAREPDYLEYDIEYGFLYQD